MSEIIEKKTLDIGGDVAYFSAYADDPYMIHFHGRQVEIDVLELVASRFIDDGAVALDVGANIGITSVAMARMFKTGTIYSFEPSNTNYKFLCQNIKENNAENCIPCQIAIGEKEGEVNFHHTLFGAGSHVVTDEHVVKGDMNTYAVKENSIDKILKKKKLARVDFVKIDVEGLELSVLKGMKETIKKYNPYIFLEFNSWTLIAFQNINPRDFLQYITNNFEFIYQISNDGTLSRITDDSSVLTFLHDNLVKHGCIDDLLLRNREGVIDSADSLVKQLSCVTTQRNQLKVEREQLRVELDAVVSERARVYESFSWKITAPLRIIKKYINL